MMETSIEVAMKKYINDAAGETNDLRKRNEMFVNEPLAYDIMEIAFKLGRADMCCDILRRDFGKQVDDYKSMIKDIEHQAYATYKELTGGE